MIKISIVQMKTMEDLPYQRWIDFYSSEKFRRLSDSFRANADRLAESASPKVLRQMHNAFDYAIRLEYSFWESAWNLKKWL